jgi:hypothetical protein
MIVAVVAFEKVVEGALSQGHVRGIGSLRPSSIQPLFWCSEASSVTRESREKKTEMVTVSPLTWDQIVGVVLGGKFSFVLV